MMPRQSALLYPALLASLLSLNVLADTTTGAPMARTQGKITGGATGMYTPGIHRIR